MNNSIAHDPRYDLSAFRNHSKVGVGTSNPDLYTNCSDFSFAKSCGSYAQDKCRSFVVKGGIGVNHEFIDAPLAAMFLNSASMRSFVLYPQDGYHIEPVGEDRYRILGSASPLICEFISLTGIFKRHDHHKPFDGEVRVDKRDFERSGYIAELNNFLKQTDPLSIVGYFITQYISGGGDPNSGNIGFARNTNPDAQYKYVFTKVDLGASFKAYKKAVKGSTPGLQYNRYAFTLPIDIKNLDDLYQFTMQNGRILMPGPEYSPLKSSNTGLFFVDEQNRTNSKEACLYGLCVERIWLMNPSQYDSKHSGRVAAGFYDGVYRGGTRGVNIRDYVNTNNFTAFLLGFCSPQRKSEILESLVLAQMELKSVMNSSIESSQILSLIKTQDGTVVGWDEYMGQIPKFVSARYNRICSFSPHVITDKPHQCDPHVALIQIIEENGLGSIDYACIGSLCCGRLKNEISAEMSSCTELRSYNNLDTLMPALEVIGISGSTIDSVCIAVTSAD